ncbi:ShlB/FhaC/HecB family hemolysin secretion/activation protein [Providencia sp. PROV272]|uniref:ShlB/FhaC/HecB family hemolysin secretion/activation protein n=1 Tax=Providencia sp. PROV272 TaxID=2936800 RepID=UPI003CF25B64
MKTAPTLFILLFLLFNYLPCYANRQLDFAVKSPSTPCIAIHQVHFSTLALFPLITSSDINKWKQGVEGRCVSEEGLLRYADFLNAQLAEVGYITSSIHYPEQTLLFGVLQVELVAGKLGSIEYQDSASQSLAYAFPLRKGQVVDIHAINQGLANLRNTQLIPHQIHIVSDHEQNNMNRLVIQRNAARAFKGKLLLASKQSPQFPTHVVSNLIMLANPLALNDFFFLNLDSDIGKEPEKKLKSVSILYSVPYHYWLLSLYAGYQENSIHQNFQLIDSIKVRNDVRSRLLSLQAEYVLHRALYHSTSISMGTQIQTLDLFLERYRLKTQQRFTSYLLLGVKHQRHFAQGNVTFSLSYKQDTDWFGSTRRQVTGLERAGIYLFSVDFQRQFYLANQSMYHRHELEMQLSRSPLDPQLELNSPTGKFGIRGFSNSVLTENLGDNTLKLKNEWVWFTPWRGYELYGALDFASTSSQSAHIWRDNRLFGTEIGVRGQIDRLNYQLFIEAPLWQSAKLATNAVNVGAKVSIDY